VNGQEKHRAPYEALLLATTRVPYGDADAARDAVDGRTAAFVVEPIQGEGGVNVPPPGYLGALREICDAQGALLLADEIQTGIGRTGAMLACDHEGVVPDVVILGKGLGGGFPIAAFLRRRRWRTSPSATTAGPRATPWPRRLERGAARDREARGARRRLGERVLGNSGPSENPTSRRRRSAAPARPRAPRRRARESGPSSGRGERPAGRVIRLFPAQRPRTTSGRRWGRARARLSPSQPAPSPAS
jgi:hypothetical protein